MKVLVIVRHVLFLRFLEPVIKQLHEAGHAVEVGYTTSIADCYVTELLGLSWARKLDISAAPLKEGWLYRGLLILRLLQDYLRYCDPVYDDSPGLRNRAADPIPQILRLVFRLLGARILPLRWAMIGLLRRLDRWLPCNPAASNFLASRRHDLLLVTPLVDPTSGECEYLKCAIRRGDRTVLLVASWDNLTNKGLVQFEPDRVLVWNHWIAREAMKLHRIPKNKIRITGAPVFDAWFSMRPTLSRVEMVTQLGLVPDRPIILYLCSSSFIAGQEIESIIDWLNALRSYPDDRVSNAGVLIRPHPGNPQDWKRLSNQKNVAVWPSAGEQVLDEDARARYFDSIYHAKVIVAVNTSGMIEAGIVGRPVVMLSDKRMQVTQEGTLHFRLLVENGLIQKVTSEAEHFQKLAEYITGTDDDRKKRDEFIMDFVRPCGLSAPAATMVVDELVALAQ